MKYLEHKMYTGNLLVLFNLSVTIFLFLFPISSSFAGPINSVLPLTILEKLIIYFSFLILALCHKISSQTLLSLFFTVFLLIVQLVLYNSNLGLSINALLRLTFPFILFVCLKHYSLSYRDSFVCFKYCFFIFYFLTVLSILGGYMTGFGTDIGGRGESVSGNKGFFVGANEVGILLLLQTIVLNRLATPILRDMFLFGISVCGLIVLTKSSLMASLFSLFLIVYNHKTVRHIAFLFIVFLFLYYMESLILYISNLVAGTFLDVSIQSPAQFMLRGRQNYIDAFFENIDLNSNLNLFRFVFLGFGENYVADTIAKGLEIPLGRRSTFEMDLLDLCFSMGFIFSSLYLLLVFGFFVKLVRFLRWKEVCIILAIFFHAILAGHVVYSPMITCLLVILYFYVKQDSETTIKYQ